MSVVDCVLVNDWNSPLASEVAEALVGVSEVDGGRDRFFNIQKYRDSTGSPREFELHVGLVGGRPRFCLGTRRWVAMPYFSTFDFRSLRPEFLADRETLNHFLELVFARFHAERRFTFIYSTRERPGQKSRWVREKDLVPIGGLALFERYHFSIDAILPKGHPARYEYQTSLVNPDRQDGTYWIKRGTLKPEYILDYIDSSPAPIG